VREAARVESRPPAAAARPRRVAALALVPLALALLWRLPDLALPPHGEHAWRDADGIGVARCFAREALDLLHPRVVERQATPGIVGMEFPVVNAAGAVLMRAFGVRDALARLPSWLALLPLCAGAWALGRRLLGDRAAAAVAAGCLAVEPLVVIYARKCMPEVPMLAALVWAMALAHDALFRPSVGRGAAAGALFALAALLKPTGFAVAVPLAMWLARAWRERPPERRRVAAAAAVGVALPVAATIAWYAHAEALLRQYRLPMFKLYHDWFEWVRLLPSPTFLNVVYFRALHLYLLWPTIIWMAIRWRDTAATAREHADVAAWGAAGVASLMLFGSHLTNHPYYAIPALPPIALFAGAFAARAARRHVRPALVEAAFVALFAVTALVRVEQRAAPLRFDPPRVAAAMRHVPEGLTVATDARTNVVSLVIVDRLGWALAPSELTPEAIARLRGEGARVLVESSFGGWLSPEARAALPPAVYADDQLRAYALASP
jgi:4-amino-4-deoxy-L-arabinose transferase-like glycosyltransferase